MSLIHVEDCQSDLCPLYPKRRNLSKQRYWIKNERLVHVLMILEVCEVLVFPYVIYGLCWRVHKDGVSSLSARISL